MKISFLNKIRFAFIPIALLTQMLCAFTSCIAQAAIQLNQIGYYPASAKYAVITHAGDEDSFDVVNIQTDKPVFKGRLSQIMQSPFSDTRTRIANFSSVTANGAYKIVTGSLQSHTFKIKNNVLEELSKAVLKGYYYQRVSLALEPRYAGKWSRAAGHKDDSVLIHPSAASDRRTSGTVIGSAGGWYDAGDYNKYIVNSGITMGTLLAAYEDLAGYYHSLSLNIPESSNDVPDILDEILYNLRWMFTMQDPNDGGVYNKCTNAKFDGAVKPGATKAPRYVVQKGTAAALDFAAVMAQAARVYSKFTKELPGLTDSCLKAAVQAWNWAVANPSAEYNQEEMNKKFLPAVTTGPYGDKYFEDEWFWAAVELTVTTGNPIYLQNNLVNANFQPNIPSWSKVNMLGVYTALKNKALFAGTKIETDKLQNELIAYANQLVSGGNSAFKTVMGQSKRDFIWGSNSVAANQSMLLLKVYAITKAPKYLEGAVSNLDYILGRNATGYCFVTGLGTRSPIHIHHRPSQSDGIAEPVPGLLAGGPNPGRQDKCYYPFTEAETSYIDNDCSFASNEITINWNAPLVYVVGALEMLYQ